MRVPYKDYSLLNLSPELTEKYKKWAVLCHGSIKRIPNEETYSCSIWLAPQNWHLLWPKLSKKEKQNCLKRSLVSTDILGGIVPGTVLTSENDVVDNTLSLQEKLIIPIDNTVLHKARFISDIIGSNFIDYTPFGSIYLSKLPCFEIISEVNEKQIKVIVTCAEVARQNFFKGQEVTRCLLNKTYSEEMSSSNLLITDENPYWRKLVIGMKQGYADEERKVLGRIALSEDVNNAVNYMYNSIYPKPENGARFLRTSFPFRGEFKIGVTGFYLNPPSNNIFYVNQIHQSSEDIPFDELNWFPISGKRNDIKNENSQVGTNGGNPVHISQVFQSMYPKIDIEAKPNDKSKVQNIELEYDEYNFFEKKHTKVSESTTTNSQDCLKGKVIITNIVGDLYSTKHVGIDSSNVGRAHLTIVENDENNTIKYETDFILALSNSFKSAGWSIKYYDIKNDQFIIDNKNITFDFKEMKYCIIQLIRNQRCFYIFEHISKYLSKHRTSLIYANNEGYFSSIILARVLNSLNEYGSKWIDSQENKLRFIKQKSFNHKQEGMLISGEYMAEKIIDFINSKTD